MPLTKQFKKDGEKFLAEVGYNQPKPDAILNKLHSILNSENISGKHIEQTQIHYVNLSQSCSLLDIQLKKLSPRLTEEQYIKLKSDIERSKSETCKIISDAEIFLKAMASAPKLPSSKRLKKGDIKEKKLSVVGSVTHPMQEENKKIQK